MAEHFGPVALTGKGLVIAIVSSLVGLIFGYGSLMALNKFLGSS